MAKSIHMSGEPLDRLRAICLALPGTEERLSHGEPCWFIEKGKQFVSFDDHHHGEDRLAFWCAAPEGSQLALVESKPEQYFVPPYVGHRGWIGVRLDRKPDWGEIEDIVIDAFLTVAPKRLADQLPDRLDV
jgi:hypothetical protein